MNPFVHGVILALLAASTLAGWAREPADAKLGTPGAPDVASVTRGAAVFAGICAACHAPDGNSLIPLHPKLAQQHPEYLVKQLVEFKSGKRASPIMQGMAGTLGDDDMRSVADWAASQRLATGASPGKQQGLPGDHIYRGGIQERHVPACAGCHGPHGAGIPVQYPRLGGQHADYIMAQLTAFRDGVRQNSPTMTQVAATLNDREIRAVADYAASLR